jgi:tetratricopeptide (TPR) repeat protein
VLLDILKRKPDDATALSNLGFVRAEQKRLPEAIELFKQSIEADPSSAPARINLGRALLVLGRNNEARNELERALQVATTDEERGRAELELGHVAEAGGRPETWAVAIEHYEAVRQLYPDDPMQLGAQIDKLKSAIAEAQAHAKTKSETETKPESGAPR